MPTHVVIQPDPYLVPAILLAAGLLILLIASVRGRTAERWRRLLRIGYGTAAVATLMLGTGMAVQRAPLFWGIEWNESQQTLRLERPLPLGAIEIPGDDVKSVMEFSNTERSLTGQTRITRFLVETKSGDSYWSAPLYHRSGAESTRLALLWATRGRLQRFQVGTAPLPE